MSEFVDDHFESKNNSLAREYYGLRNQGSTCYLNSVLQVLFMTKDFREAVGRCPNNCENPIDHQLNTLFEHLEEGTGETYEVTQKLGIDRVNEQRDAGEYLEKILSLASDQASEIFEVQLINRTVCNDCKEEDDEEKSFWNLPLPLRVSSDENYSVMKAIQDFFKDSECIEDNQLYCEKCEGKRDATVKCVVKKHPEVLMLLLKRFEFNYYQMSYVKNSCDVDVPFTVKIPENQRYELYGFVEHFGSLKSGHYTATIKSPDENRWYNFNDSRVRELKKPPFQRTKIERSQSAYLLFYRKKSTDQQDNRKGSQTGDLLPDDENSGFYPNVLNNKKDKDAAERTKMREINSANATPIGGSSDTCNIKVHTKQQQPNGDLDNDTEGNALPCNQNDGGVQKKKKDENRVGSEGEPGDQVQTRIEEDSSPKRRRISDYADKDGRAGITGRTPEEMLEASREKMAPEPERLNNKQRTPEEKKHELRDNSSKQVEYKTGSQVESRDAMQINQEQKTDVKADVHRDTTTGVKITSQMEEGSDFKPNQQKTKEAKKNSSDNQQGKRRDKVQNGSEEKKDKRKNETDDHSKITSIPSSLQGTSDTSEKKKAINTRKEKDKSKKKFPLPWKKSRKGQQNEEGQNKRTESHVGSSSETDLDREVCEINTAKKKAKKSKPSLNCFGKKKKISHLDSGNI